MGVEVAVANDKVEGIRKVLDPLAKMPPTVGTNAMVPGSTFLTYHAVKDEVGLMLAAMQNGAGSCSRC